MRYIFAFLVPPLAIAMCGRWGHFTLNLIFWIVSLPLLFMGIGFIIWLICTSHALSVCKMSSLDKRVNRIVGAIQAQQPPVNNQ
jgi:hypothetical protein